MTPSGFILLDKVAGETSFKALFPLKRVFCTKRVGHAGTLDLRASGLIIAATGRATRLLPFVEAKDKCYTFRLHLGYETDTLEWDGEVVCLDERRVNIDESGETRDERIVDKDCLLNCHTANPNSPSSSFRSPEGASESSLDERRETRDERGVATIDRAALEAILPQFIGDIDQIPPNYCAVKVNGRRASDWMERGRDIELKPRRIHIGSLKVIGEGLETEGCTGKCFATFDLECECSKGTYIRALGRDLAKALGTCGCVSMIRRHRIGNVTLERAVRGEDLTQGHMIPVNEVLDFPVVHLTKEQASIIRNGNWVPWKEPVEGMDSEKNPDGHVFVTDESGIILSLCHYEPGRIMPKLFLAGD